LRIGVEVGLHRTRADATEAGQAVAHVEHERFARLLAVVYHVEPGLDLLADNRAHRGAALRIDLGGIDRLARQALRVEPRQRGRARQAPGMRGEDAMFAALHFRPAFRFPILVPRTRSSHT
jgi:hypothetical protein